MVGYIHLGLLVCLFGYNKQFSEGESCFFLWQTTNEPFLCPSYIVHKAGWMNDTWKQRTNPDWQTPPPPYSTLSPLVHSYGTDRPPPLNTIGFVRVCWQKKTLMVEEFSSEVDVDPPFLNMIRKWSKNRNSIYRDIIMMTQTKERRPFLQFQHDTQKDRFPCLVLPGRWVLCHLIKQICSKVVVCSVWGCAFFFDILYSLW